jgi:hypothetical protein
MNLRQQVMALIIGAGLFLVILDLVRRRRLDEHSSCLWLLTGLGILVLAVWYDLLLSISALIGITLPTSTVFFFGVMFLMVVSLQQATKISKLADQVKNLTQKIAIMDSYIEELVQGGGSGEGINRLRESAGENGGYVYRNPGGDSD